MMRSISIALALLLSVAVWAQPDPNEPQPNVKMGGGPVGLLMRLGFNPLNLLAAVQQPSTEMVATPQGLYILRNGVLAKFDGHSTKPACQYDLYDQLPPVPADNATDADWQAYAQAQSKRLSPAALVVKDANLFIAGKEFLWEIDANTLAMKIKIPLPQIPQPPQPQFMRPFTQEAPSLEISGQTAYLLRGDALTVIDCGAAKVLFNGPLPDNMIPVAARNLLQHFTQMNGGK